MGQLTPIKSHFFLAFENFHVTKIYDFLGTYRGNKVCQRKNHVIRLDNQFQPESFAKLNEVTKMQLTIHREHYEIDQNNSKLPDLKCDLNELPKVNKIFDDMKSLSEKISCLEMQKACFV